MTFPDCDTGRPSKPAQAPVAIATNTDNDDQINPDATDEGMLRLRARQS